MRRTSVLLTLPLLLVALLVGACEDSVNPILESDRNFSLFGTLDMDQDTQFVRVVPIRPTLFPDPNQQIDISFVSTDLTSGATTVWNDSLITFDDGSTGLIFYAPLRIRPGRTYRIEVATPSLELITSAETTAPTLPSAITIQPESVVNVGGAIGRGSQVIQWDGIVDEPFQIELWYRFLAAEATAFNNVMLPYAPANTPMGNGWEIELDLRKDRLALDTMQAVNVTEVPLLGQGLLVTVLDGAFVPPGGVFDPDVLSQPGTFSNVENGFGFVGTVGRFAAEWVFADETYDDMNYLHIEDVFGKRTLDLPEATLPKPATRVPVSP